MPLWTNDPYTREQFGYNVDLEEIGLTPATIALARLCSDLYWDRLNPVHPLFPELWSGEMCLFYQQNVKRLYDSIIREIGDKFEILNEVEGIMTADIDVRQINWDLAKFLADPMAYAFEHGIDFNVAPEQGKAIMHSAYKKWKKRESSILTRYG
jgi:predicted AlkP superfamily phosphohydrolase/phosphomutase